MKQTKARVEDALHATRAAAEEGIVPGGGVALLRCREAVEKARGSARGDEKIGVDIVLRSLPMPIRQIADNCGVDGSVVADEVSQKPTNTGYDANTGKYVDMFKAGIIDPLKVVRTALQNAASIAGLMLTTETLVTDLNKDDKKNGKSREASASGIPLVSLSKQQLWGRLVAGWPHCCLRPIAPLIGDQNVTRGV